MQKLLFTIFDEKSGVYSSPFTTINKETALRDFTYACTQDTNSELYRHKNDFHLIQLGQYDDSEGKITDDRELLVSGLNIKKEG